MIHIYLDAEFDAVRIDHKFQQAVISLGAVMLNEDAEILDQFYSLTKPMNFHRLTSVVKRMTHLTNSQIEQAKEFPVLMKKFMDWIHVYEPDMEQVRFYSFGPDDRRTLIQNCHYYKIEADFFSRMKDLQKEISPNVKFQDQLISSTLSLDDLKSVYAIEGEVEHNALNDAIDLMKVHRAYCLGKPQDSTQIAAIVNRKIAKQQEVARKQRLRLAKAMKERFEKYPKRVKIKFYPEVLEELNGLRERDHHMTIRFKTDRMIIEEQVYFYNELKLVMELSLDEEVPSFLFDISYHGIRSRKQYLLTYRNATVIENIIKRLLGAEEN